MLPYLGTLSAAEVEALDNSETVAAIAVHLERTNLLRSDRVKEYILRVSQKNEMSFSRWRELPRAELQAFLKKLERLPTEILDG
jgi:hypothetical protein